MFKLALLCHHFFEFEFWDRLLAASNINQYGRKYSPAQLVQRITGEAITGDAFMEYLEEKWPFVLIEWLSLSFQWDRPER